MIRKYNRINHNECNNDPLLTNLIVQKESMLMKEISSFKDEKFEEIGFKISIKEVNNNVEKTVV